MKKYKTWEAIKMITENDNLIFERTTPIGESISICSSILGYLKLTNKPYDSQSLDGNIKLDTEWELVQQPVTFEEVLNSDKKCRVEHVCVDEMLSNTHITFEKYTLSELFKAIKTGEYLLFDDIMLLLSKYLTHMDLKTVIKEGKWFLEE